MLTARDIRDATLFKETEALQALLRRPGSGRISDASEIAVCPDAKSALFTGTIVESFEGNPTTRICRVDFRTGQTSIVTMGPNRDWGSKFSSRGQAAFLSDRADRGNPQLIILDVETGETRSPPNLDGWVDAFHWSPDGHRILLVLAGHGADLAAPQGATSTRSKADDLPSWVPNIEPDTSGRRSRSAWIYDLTTDGWTKVRCQQLNVWDACWCGDQRVALVASEGVTEGSWYGAQLYGVDLVSDQIGKLYQPKFQLGAIQASPDGARVVVVDAVASDRKVVAGRASIVDTTTNATAPLCDTELDVAQVSWLNNDEVMLTGHVGLNTVVSLVNFSKQRVTELWRSKEISTGGVYASVASVGKEGAFALVAEGFRVAPEIGVVANGDYRTVVSFDLGYGKAIEALANITVVEWEAPDGLRIEGWLLCPVGSGPFPMIMDIHGGPVWHWRSRWLGRGSFDALLMLRRGYAIFLPNPRGSSGRGHEFAQMVVGDMGGRDSFDLLSGVDHLVATGFADPNRLGVMGASYGGYMTSWLVTQDNRFSAALAIAPVTNKVSQHLLSNIPQFVSMFLADRYDNPRGRYFERSPVMHAQHARTPTLNVCGALDRCTPPEEAVQFHNALVEHGCDSVLLTYPSEGHGISSFPACIDFVARAVSWFEKNLKGSAQSG